MAPNIREIDRLPALISKFWNASPTPAPPEFEAGIIEQRQMGERIGRAIEQHDLAQVQLYTRSLEGIPSSQMTTVLRPLAERYYARGVHLHWNTDSQGIVNLEL